MLDFVRVFWLNNLFHFLKPLFNTFQVDRKEIDEMKLGENIVSCTTSSMKGDNITLMNENKENPLEKIDLNVRLSMVSNVLCSHFA